MAFFGLICVVALTACGPESKNLRTTQYSETQSSPTVDDDISANGSNATGAEASSPQRVGIAPAVPTMDSTNLLSSLSVGTFNFLRLGWADKDLNRVADLVAKAEFDVFGATEILEASAATEFLDVLRARTGEDWRLRVSRYANGESTYKEYFGFFYRGDRVAESRPEASFCASSDGVGRTGSACYARDPGGSSGPAFERDPFVGHFTAGGHEFTMINVHLVYGGTTSEEILRRQNEMRALRRVMDSVRRQTPESKVLLVGDFNLTVVTDDDAPEPEESRWSREAMPPEVFSSSPRINGIVDEGTTIGNSSYDHILYYENSDWMLEPNSTKVVVDFNRRSDAERARFRAEVSDHYPIRATFNLPE